MTTSDKSQDELEEKIDDIIGDARNDAYQAGGNDSNMDLRDYTSEIMQLIAANNARVTTEILELLITEGYQHHERDMKLQNTMESMLQDINASRPTATGTEGGEQ